MKKNFLNQIKKGINYSVVGSLGLIVVTTLTGCEEKKPEEKQQVFSDVNKAQNTFFVIEEKPVGNFKVLEQHPTTGATRAIIRDENGTERVMTEEEIKKLAQKEAEKVNSGTSNLTNATPPSSLSLGEAILASATGAILGSLVGNAIANKMMNNDRFQQAQRQANLHQPSISRPMTSTPSMGGATPSAGTQSQPKSGFFGGTPSSTSPSTTPPTSPKPDTNSGSISNKPTTSSSGSFGGSSTSHSPSSSGGSFGGASHSSSSSSSSSSGSFGG